MKKIVYILLVTTLSISCSSDDDSGEPVQNSISPPDWIQGEWLQQNGDSTIQNGFKFTTDDFLTVQSSFNTSYKEQVEVSSNADASTNVDEIKSENEYKIEINFSGQIVKYYFEKKSESVLEWTNDPLGDLSETLFTKQ